MYSVEIDPVAQVLVLQEAGCKFRIVSKSPTQNILAGDAWRNLLWPLIKNNVITGETLSSKTKEQIVLELFEKLTKKEKEKIKKPFWVKKSSDLKEATDCVPMEANILIIESLERESLRQRINDWNAEKEKVKNLNDNLMEKYNIRREQDLKNGKKPMRPPILRSFTLPRPELVRMNDLRT